MNVSPSVERRNVDLFLEIVDNVFQLSFRCIYFPLTTSLAFLFWYGSGTAILKSPTPRASSLGPPCPKWVPSQVIPKLSHLFPS